jgi:hypothetical protein
MDPSVLQSKLIEAARLDTPGTEVPYAFEKRVMANLSRAKPDRVNFWAQALWRAVAPCAAVALMLAAWTFLGSGETSAPEEFAQHFESTVLAGGTVDSIPYQP